MAAIKEATNEENTQAVWYQRFGLLNVTRAVLPPLRKERSGLFDIEGISRGLVADASTLSKLARDLPEI